MNPFVTIAGLKQFLNYLQEQKEHLDTHYAQYKEQQAQAEQTKLKIQDLAKYLKELKERAVDDAIGWTQEASDKANEMWSQISQYEKIHEEKIVVRRDVSHDDMSSSPHAPESWDLSKDAVSKAWDHSKDSASSAAHHADDVASQAYNHAQEGE